MIISISFGSLAAMNSRRAVVSFASGLIFAILVWPIAPVYTWAAAAKKHSFAFSIENGRVTGVRRTVRFKEGDFVELSLEADSNIELHLHGYNLHLYLKPGETRTMSFQAHTVGSNRIFTRF